jgi:threonine/homoserine efflux transporter RhtA
MKSKALLFIGILLLILGIIIRKMTSLEVLGLIFILTGVLCKTVYIIAKARSGEYQPGKELIFLGVGLVFFLSGLYLRNLDQNLIDPSYLIVFGIALKIFFIIRFIQILRKEKIKHQHLV